MSKLNRFYNFIITFMILGGVLLLFPKATPVATLSQYKKARQTDDHFVYLPFISKPLPPPDLSINETSFTHDGVFSVEWTLVDSITMFRLVEDDNSLFTSPEIVYEGPNLFWPGVNKPCGVPIYYRVMGLPGPKGGTDWSETASVTPKIEFTFVPEIGSNKKLKGKVCVSNPENYEVAVYIWVLGQWWTKPYWDKPLRKINNDGTWEANITTGGVDPSATQIAAFLVPKGTTPRLCGGPHGRCSTLPPVMLNYCHVIVSR